MSIINTIALSGNKSKASKITLVQKGQSLTYSLDQLDARASNLAGHLCEAGLQRGDRIGVFARNGIEWVLLDLACIKAGLVMAGFEYGRFVPSATLFSQYELKAVYSEAPVEPHGIIDLHSILGTVNARQAPPAACVQYQPSDITTIKFTSGSTGAPKGLCATVGSIDSAIVGVQSIFAHSAADNILVFLPLSLLQQRYWIYSALAFGHDVTVTAHEFVFEATKETRPSVIMGVPGFFDAIKKRVEQMAPAAREDLTVRRNEIEALLGPRIRYLWTGSAPASMGTLNFFNACGLPLFEGYGMNETCIVSKNYRDNCRIGSVGRVLPNKRATIDDDGVLIVGSDFPVNTRYAYCAPGDNENTFLPNGDVRTGDLARFDEDGYLYILGRADDIVVLANGKNIYTRTLEEKVRTHAAAAECVVYGAGKPFLVAVISPAILPVDESAILRHVQQVNASTSGDEQIVRTFCAPEPFSVENGLLTSQYKPKRKEIYRLFKTQIDALYGVQR